MEKEIVIMEKLGPKEIVTFQEGTIGGTTNYNNLSNKPKINGVILEGDKKSTDLKLQDNMKTISNLEIEQIFKM